MKKLFLEVECPSCRRKIPIRVEEMVPGGSRRCPSCDATIRFGGDDGRRVQRALDDLERSINEISR